MGGEEGGGDDTVKTRLRLSFMESSASVAYYTELHIALYVREII